MAYRFLNFAGGSDLQITSGVCPIDLGNSPAPEEEAGISQNLNKNGAKVPFLLVKAVLSCSNEHLDLGE